MGSESKKIKSHCNRCGPGTKHYLRFEHAVQDSEDIAGGDYSVEWGSNYAFLECCGCSSVSIRQRDWCSESDRGEYVETVFPPRVSRRKPSYFDELPRDYRALLEEIYTALHADSRRLALMGARAIIDIFIASKVGDKGTFGQGMDALVSSEYISEKDRRIIESAVDAGHAAAHRGYDPSIKNISTVMDIVENLIQKDTISEPAEALRKDTPVRRSRTIEKGKRSE